MQVHEVERDSTLQITVNMAQCDLVADVLDPQVGQMGLGNGLVYSFVLADTSLEIRFGLLARHILVVGIARRDLKCDVGGDDSGIVANRFQEDEH